MDKEKSVDESWKEQAAQEKETLSTNGETQAGETASAGQPAAEPSAEPAQSAAGGEEPTEMEITFLNYITSLGFQALIFMGEIPNPVTEKTEKNLPQAKFLVDTLAMIKEKTKGNLSDQEKNILEGTVYELQLKYVQVAGGESAEGKEAS